MTRIKKHPYVISAASSIEHKYWGTKIKVAPLNLGNIEMSLLREEKTPFQIAEKEKNSTSLTQLDFQ